MNTVSVARKLSSTEERNQEQSCLVAREDYRDKRQNILCSSPGEDGFRGKTFGDMYRMIEPAISFLAINRYRI